MSKRSQKKFAAEEKYQILQEGESGTMSINEVCRRHGIRKTIQHPPSYIATIGARVPPQESPILRW